MSSTVDNRSRFDLVTCKRYAKHLADTEQGVQNPGGFAQSIYRSGSMDEDIEAWLAKESKKKPSRGHIETEQEKNLRRDCKQCRGSGFVQVQREYLGRKVWGALYQTYIDSEGEEQRKLVMCDHVELYFDPKHGEQAEA